MDTSTTFFVVSLLFSLFGFLFSLFSFAVSLPLKQSDETTVHPTKAKVVSAVATVVFFVLLVFFLSQVSGSAAVVD